MAEPMEWGKGITPDGFRVEFKEKVHHDDDDQQVPCQKVREQQVGIGPPFFRIITVTSRTSSGSSATMVKISSASAT
jgi:hypothetical protein